MRSMFARLFCGFLLRRRFLSNVRRRVDERAGVQIRSVPAELSNEKRLRYVQEEEEKSFVSSRLKDEKRAEDEDEDEDAR